MIVSHFGLAPFLTDLKGAEASGDHSDKGKLIAQLMERNQIHPKASVVMIGDTTYDMAGAKENRISCIAVGYGFGTKDSLIACQPDYFVETTAELAGLLMA
jgi:phosphoglycolate phosphatase